ncbi:MAG: hypothetical protein WCF54_10095 [Terracidiphilus sp.]
MKKFVAVFCLLLCAATLQAKDKPNPADFNIKIHISATQILPRMNYFILYVDAILDGKKVKLAIDNPGPSNSKMHNLATPHILVPGDYQIRLKKDESEKDSGCLSQEYEILLPNGDIWECWLVGISE